MTQCVIRTEFRDITLHANTLACLDNETLFAWCEESTDPLVQLLAKRLQKFIADNEIAVSEEYKELKGEFDQFVSDIKTLLAGLKEVRSSWDDFEHKVKTELDDVEHVKNDFEIIIDDIGLAIDNIET